MGYRHANGSYKAKKADRHNRNNYMVVTCQQCGVLACRFRLYRDSIYETKAVNFAKASLRVFKQCPKAPKRTKKRKGA